MKSKAICCGTLAALLVAVAASATIFGNVRGIVHDLQHRPMAGVTVRISALTSAWSRSIVTDADGEFEFSAVPVGNYQLTVKQSGFEPLQRQVTVTSGSAPVLHLQLQIEAVKQTVEVSAAPDVINTQSSSAETMVNRRQIAQTPGADHTNSLAMITDYVPGAYMVHDQLHLRGGHQVTWEIDGVPVPNTNIASNVGPQFDPKDVDYLEVKRGGYSAEYGNRTYGVFNVIPRTGFEYNNAGELVTSYGSFNQTNDQINLGSHTERFAYYASLNANRSDLGLMTPTPAVIHNMNSGVGGFGSLIFNATPRDQFRLVTSLRKDHYQIPHTPEQQADGIRDVDRESDAFVNFSWVRTVNPGVLLTVSPFYHFNRANLIGGRGDTPLIVNNDRASNYVGGQAALSIVMQKHNASMGVEAYAQHDNTLFSLEATDGSGLALRQRVQPWGNLEAAFFEDQYRLTSWLTFNGGIRLTHFSGLLDENAASPRVGAALRLPKLGWVLRAFYGRYYQPPPLDTVAGPLQELALEEGFEFLPLRGERDEEHEFGITIPLRDWVLDVDNFHTRAHDFFDHDVLGNSNIFLPLTIQGARIYGWEATLRSPQILRRAHLHIAYSHQHAEGFGTVTGGLTDFSPPEEGCFFLDHDQRNTLSSVISVELPSHAWTTGTLAYGSGFLDGDGPQHLPAHTTFDVSVGKTFLEDWSVALTALNAADHRYLVDNSNTFGGTHYAYPRQVSVEIRYRFHY